jgi:replication factor C subunit 3/5
MDIDLEEEGSNERATELEFSSKRKEKEPEDKDNLPWIEKYRPKELSELISHQEILHTIGRMMDSNQLPHLLFYGPAGTGKTSTILACARKLNGPRYASMILELNASVDNGIDVIREQVKGFASSRQLFSSGTKLVILDECDNMTKAAQFALRRVIEKYTKNTRFCIICNYINKIIPALQSRCTRFRFGPLESTQIAGRLRSIASAENANLTPGGTDAIVKLSNGDMRKCLNIMQACHLAFAEISHENVYKCTGRPLPEDIKSICHFLFNDTFADAVVNIRNIQMAKGLAIEDIVTEVTAIVLRASLPPPALCFLLPKLADIEHRLSAASNPRLELNALVGAFQIAKSKAFASSPSESSREKSE